MNWNFFNTTESAELHSLNVIGLKNEAKKNKNMQIDYYYYF